MAYCYANAYCCAASENQPYEPTVKSLTYSFFRLVRALNIPGGKRVTLLADKSLLTKKINVSKVRVHHP